MGEQIGSYFSSGVGRITAFLPNLLSAIVIFAVGYLISRLLGSGVRKVLARTRFDAFAARHFRGGTAHRTASSLAGSTVFWLGLLVTLSMAANSLGLGTLSAGINRILEFIPRVLVAGVIIGVAIPVARLLGNLVQGVTSSLVGRAAQIAVLVLAGFMAFDELGISNRIVVTTFTAVLGAAAVAIAIAFGVGGIPAARELVNRGVRRAQEARVAAAEHEPTAEEIPGEPTRH
jgi:small-conductance mechanosensitive channel